MWKVRIGLVACVCILAGSQAIAAEEQDSTPATCDGHTVKFHRAKARGLAQSMFALKKWKDATPVSPVQRRYSRWHRACVEHAGTRALMRQYVKMQKREFYGYRRTFGPYTPYGAYAIPYYIVYCESGTSGDWRAYNPSGAAGRYQIMPEHGRVWPVNSWADKLQHTEIAYDLSSGGTEFSDWACA